VVYHVDHSVAEIEALVSNKIFAGEPLWGNYPPGEETIAEYKAHKEQERING
jgi:hypothetical protein